MASPTIITGSDTGVLTGGSPTTQDTFTVTIPTSGQNRMFMVMGGHGNGGSLSSATLGGQAMTVINNTVAQVYAYIAYLINPPTGSQSLVLNYASSGGPRVFKGFTLQDAAQTSSIDQTSTLTDFSSASPTSKSITTTADNELVVAVIQIHGSGSAVTSLANTWSATNVWLLQENGGTYGYGISVLEKASAGAISASYSWASANGSGNLLVVSVKYLAPTTFVPKVIII